MRIESILKFMVSLSLALFMSACGDQAQNGNQATVGMSMGSYTTARANIQPWWMSLFASKAKAAISDGSLKFCFKRLRLKLPENYDDSEQVGYDPTMAEDNVDFSLGEVIVDANGTDLGNITAPVGTYRRIEFDLENDCASGNSISLTNANGSFTSQERITIKFEGDFVVEDNGLPIVLPLDQIISSLNSFNPTSPGNQDSVSQELKVAAEVIGTSL